MLEHKLIRDKDCTRCPLSLTCNTVCYIPDYEPSDIMVVMDLPDSDTDRVGRRQSNRRMKLFDEILQDVIGYHEDYYLTYIVKCRTSDGRLPDSSHGRKCRTYLDKEIETIKPKVIISVGEPAFQVLSGQKGISKNHGEIFYYGETDIKVVPVVSPMYVENNAYALEGFAKDLDKAVNIAMGVDKQADTTVCKTVTTMAEVYELIDYIKQSGECCVDLETTGLSRWVEVITMLGISFQQGSGYAIPLWHFESPFTNDECIFILKLFEKEIFLNPKIVKIGQNFKFDMHFLKKQGIHFVGPLYDTMSMHHLLNENMKHGLKEIGPEVFPDFKDYEADVKRYKWDAIPLVILAPYCVRDTDLTIRLFHHYEQELFKDKILYRYLRNLTNPGFMLTFHVEDNGMPVDIDFVNKTIIDLEKMAEDMVKKMHQYPEVVRYVAYHHKLLNERAVNDLELKLKKHRVGINERKRKILDDINGWKLDLEDLPNDDKKSTLKKEKSLNTKIDRGYLAYDELNIPGKREQDYIDKIYEIKSGQVSVYEGFNLGSSQQLGDLMYGAHGFRFEMPYVREKKKLAPSTNADYIQDIDHQFVRDLIEYRVIMKALGTYFIGIRDRLDPFNFVHPSLLQHGTVTGRLSCSNPNLQNIPRGGGVYDLVKKMFIAPPGYTMLQLDYKQAELRLVALMGDEPTMTAIYAADGDIHTTTAQMVMGITQEEWDKFDKQKIKEKRTDAKAVNFGFIYGMSAKSFVEYAWLTYGVKFTLKQAEKIRNNYFKLYSKLKDWHSMYEAMAEQDGYVRTLFGRKRNLPDVYSRDEYKKAEALRQAINAPIQGTGGELTVFAGAIYKLRKPDYVIMINTVHDSWIFLIPTDKVQQELPLIRETFRNPCTLEYFDFDFGDVGMDVDAEGGLNWKQLEEIPEN